MKKIYLKLMALALLSVLSVTNAWADETGHHIQTPYIYYYNSEGWTNCGFLYGRSWTNWNHTCLESLSRLDDTEKLFYDHLDANWGNNYNEFAIVDASGWSCEDNDISARWGSVSHTGRKVDYDFDQNNTYYIEYTSSAPSPSYKSNAQAGIPTYATTLNIKVKESGAGSYSNGSTSDKPATTIQILGTYLSAQGTTSRTSAGWSSGSSCTYNTVISGKVTPSYSSMSGDWQFDGWWEGETRKSTNASYDFYQTSATTVEARFTRIKYTANFDFQTGSGGTSSIKTTYGSAMPAITLPSLSNYSFQGYFSGTAGTGTQYYAANGSSSGNSNLNNPSGTTLYAKWTQGVSLDANTSNGGSSNGSATAVWNGSALTGILHASGQEGYYRTGYFTAPTGGTKVLNADGTFAGENISGYITSSKWSRTSTTTLYAQWSNEYTVTFDQGSPSIVGTEEVTATYGEDMPAITVPTKTGYIFGGYFTGLNGGGTQYYEPNGESTTEWAETASPTATLHAKWTGITYYVAFDANEGTGIMANEDFTYGAASKALTTNTYTRSGYYFLGWNTKADGSGTAYYNGKSVQNLTTIDGGIVTLYAQWAKTYTLYFVTADCNWGNFHAEAKISYDDQTYYPLNGTDSWSAMTADGTVYLTHIEYDSSHDFLVKKIADVPEGSQIKFSNNGASSTNYMSWTSEKPYYVYGNSTWYALDIVSPRTISKVTNMVVHMGDGSEYGIDQIGDEQYAIVELNGNTEYRFKYYNWLANSWSGCTSSDKSSAYLINEKTETGFASRTLNGAGAGYDSYFYTTVAGEYKFTLNGWDGYAPRMTLYYPVGVSLAIDINEAIAGATTTVHMEATKGANYLMTSPTYYYQMSTDNGKKWTTIAETSSASYDYTFAAQKCKFRVILKNDAGLRSTSGTQDFSTYSTKSFYVYNPYNNSTNLWQWLHLYTWDSNSGNTLYNGTWDGTWGYIDCAVAAGTKSTTCHNGNMIEAKGGNWFYITIDERANCFMLVGNSPYKDHQTITCYVNNYIEGGKYMIYTENNQNKVVAYQAKGASDYRLKYTYGSPAKYRYSPIYNTTLDGATVPTSMWMDASSGTSLTIQQGTGNNTWTDKKTYTNSSNGFGGIVPEGYRGHGYVFQMQINFNTGTPTNSTISNVAVSNGPFYVRTDGLTGGWNVYKKADHTMHHSAASLTSGSPAYDYYLCKWVGTAGTNVKFTVADDYNPELVESLARDPNSGDPLETREDLPTATNVRFSWDSRTNTLTRSYLSGSSAASDRFLVLVETSGTKGKIYREDGKVPTGDDKISGLNNNELIFSDLGNWVYQIIMMANPGAEAKVTAKYNSQEAEFIPSTTLIGGSGSSKHTYRIIYDFKTNELTNAWVPDGTDITSEIDLNTNVMIIRNGQGAGIQIHFTGSGKVIHAKKLLGVMEFSYDNMVGQMSSWNTTAYEQCMHYISFPYDVKVSDIFGVGEMGTDWKLQYYDGAERASKGFFRGDGTTTFWKDVPEDGTLKANVGYSLLLNRIKFNDNTSDLWENKTSGSKLYLYFPSQKSFENDSIIASDTKTISVPSHECTIDRPFVTDKGTVNHKFTDSHWNMMGIPLFENQTSVETSKFVTTKADQTTPFEANTGYFYEWTPSTNTFAVRSTSGYEFQSMHGYMIQFTGSVEFTGSSLQPKPSIVSRRQKQDTKNYMVELELLRENEHTSRTYVELREEACDTFALNEDMYMMYTSRPADIYTMAGNYDVSANVVSVQSHIIPVGVEVHKAGSFTFTMPSNFDGTVILVDSLNNTRTNLAMEDYDVTLSKGTISDRFYLEIDINNMPTAIDGVEGGSLKDGKAHKFIQNGVMYILKDGELFDARGNRVK